MTMVATEAQVPVGRGYERAASELGLPYRFPFQLGVYMAVNAISDATLLIDGPDCVIRKAQWLQGRHDWQATLLDATGRHRVVPTLLHSDRVVNSRGEQILDRITRIDAITSPGIILVCAMPHVAIIGTQYDLLIRDAQPHTRARLVEIPGMPLQGDWIDGYADTLLSLARSLDLSGGITDRSRVAVVGHLMDRLEEDQRANVAELRRILGTIGLDVVSVWLDGGPSTDLAAVRHAGTIVALPHGRRAAAEIARRTGATVVEAATPFGLGRTRRLLMAVGRATGRAERAEAFIDAELRRVVPRVGRVIDRTLAGRRLVYAGEPAMIGGMMQLSAEAGMDIVHLASSAAQGHAGEDLGAAGDDAPPCAWQPSQRELMGVHRAALEARVDLLIGDNHFLSKALVPASRHVELGFPSVRSHALHESPTLGFAGWTWTVNRLVGALAAVPA